MARNHVWQYLINEQGQPIQGATIQVYKAGTETVANIFHSERGGSADTVGQVTTLSNGFFEFWIADSSEVGGHISTQKFKIAWDKAGVIKGYIDYVDVFGFTSSYYPVELGNTDNVFDKSISNLLGTTWNQHVESTHSESPHGIQSVNITDNDTTMNKLVSNNQMLTIYDAIGGIIGGTTENFTVDNLTVNQSAFFTNAPSGGEPVLNNQYATKNYVDNYQSTSSVYNIKVGYHALFDNTTGDYDVAIGYGALKSNTEGQYNTAIGAYALYDNTTGYDNAAIGYEALIHNTFGFGNTSVGYRSLHSNLTGNYNIAVGYNTLYGNQDGNDNIALGFQAQQSRTSGNDNIAIGAAALTSNINGGKNTAIGVGASGLNTGSGNVSVGYKAGRSDASSNHLWIGNDDNGGGTYLNTWLYGDESYNITIPNGSFTAGDAYITTLTSTNVDALSGSFDYQSITTADILTLNSTYTNVLSGSYSHLIATDAHISTLSIPVSGQTPTLAAHLTTKAYVDSADNLKLNLLTATENNVPTGFVDQTTSTLSLAENFGAVNDTFKVTITGTNFPVYINGIRHLKNTESVTQVAATSKRYFIYYDSITKLLTVSGTVWNIESENYDGMAFVCTVLWDAVNHQGILEEERHHSWRDIHWHHWAHHSVGPQYSTIHHADAFALTNPGANQYATFSIAAGNVYDEDISNDMSSAATTCNLFMHHTDGTMKWVKGSVAPYYAPAGIPQYDTVTGPAPITGNNTNGYFVSWVYGTNGTGANTNSKIAIVVGQNTTTTMTLTQAQNVSFPTLPVGFIIEWKLLYKMIFRYGTGSVLTWISNQDYRLSGSIPNGQTPISNVSAASVSNTPYDGITAVDVQTAINQIADKLTTVNYNVASIMTAQSYTGTAADLQILGGTDLVVTENAGAYNDGTSEPLRVTLTFDSVVSFNKVHLHYRYYRVSSSTTHTVNLEIWNKTTTLWDSILSPISNNTSSLQNVTWNTEDSVNYIDTSNSNRVKIRFNHTSTGNTSDRLEIDHAILVHGLSGGEVVTSHQGLSDRDLANQHPATSITNTPAGLISSTDVQTALNELDTEKVALAGIPGGQTINGGTAASENLTLSSTAHGTKGIITLNSLTTIVGQYDTRVTFTPLVTGAISLNYATGNGKYIDASGISAGQTLTVTTTGWPDGFCMLTLVIDTGANIPTVTVDGQTVSLNASKEHWLTLCRKSSGATTRISPALVY